MNNLNGIWSARTFNILNVVFLVVMLVLAWNSGLNEDDKFQVDYSEKLTNYVTSFGADKEALYIEKAKMHYYGGFFEIVAGVTNRVLGLTPNDVSYHKTRHLWIAFLGWLGLFAAGRIAHLFGGWRAAIFTILFLFFAPRYLGHSLINPKDLPFATGTIVAIFGILRLTFELPKPRWSTLAAIAGGLIIAIGTRIGGLIIIGYFGVLFILFYGSKLMNRQKNETLGSILIPPLKWGIPATLVGWGMAYLFWPYGLQSPIAHSQEVLGKFSDFFINIRVLYLGENIMSNTTGWHYGTVWILRTLPLFGFVGLLSGLFFARRISSWEGWSRYAFLWFTALFPILYIIAKESSLYTGWRHLLFVYPPMAVIMGLGWHALLQFAEERLPKWAPTAALVILGITVLEPATFIARNAAFPYLYFSPVSGGIGNNFGKMDTDYWGVSVEEGVEWLEEQGVLHAGMTDTVIIATTFPYPLEHSLKAEYRDFVIPVYVRYYERFSRPWDYALLPSQYIKGVQMRAGKWPTSKATHVVKANGTPVLEILTDAGNLTYQASELLKKNDQDGALPILLKEVQAHPDNEIAWAALTRIYLAKQDFAKAENAATQTINAAPGIAQAYVTKGLVLLQTGRADQAETILRQGLELDETSATSYYYLALIEQNRKNYAFARDNAEKAIQYAPRFREAYTLLATIYDQMGNAAAANQIRQAQQNVR